MTLIVRLRHCIWLTVALVVVVSVHVVSARPIGFSVQSDGDDHLYRIDLATGVATDVGPTGLDDIEGLALQPGTGELFGWDQGSSRLVTIDVTTGAAAPLGPSGIAAGNSGLTFDASGRLYLSDDLVGRDLYDLDPSSGAATFLGQTGAFDVIGLEDAGGNLLYGLDQNGDNQALNLVTVQKDNGTTTLIGDTELGLGISGGAGLGFDGIELWGLADSGEVFTVDVNTGLATVVANTLGGFEGLAVLLIPEPAAGTMILLLGGGWLCGAPRRLGR